MRGPSLAQQRDGGEQVGEQVGQRRSGDGEPCVGGEEGHVLLQSPQGCLEGAPVVHPRPQAQRPRHVRVQRAGQKRPRRPVSHAARKRQF